MFKLLFPWVAVITATKDEYGNVSWFCDVVPRW